ncbi:MAG: HAD family hydrolase [Muribaculaceae bacterium]|nr:HAD family hydrolase [Muribaculaceae bacterium]
MLSKPQALIFDMDGTLWDATASYARIWNICSAEFGVPQNVTADILKQYMGKQLEDILFGLFGCSPSFNVADYISRLSEIEEEMMPQLGGELYPGVFHGLQELSKKYKLMAQSNCGRLGLKNFMQYTNTKPFFCDSLTFGESPVPKAQNIATLMKRNGIERAVYVGDTQGDCDNAHRTGVPFAYAAYGFGSCSNPEYTFISFNELVNYFIELQ